MSSWILSLKLALISVGVVSLAFKLSLPVVPVPPPYLYIIINAIIVTIAASSRFQKAKSVQAPFPSQYDTRTVLDEYLYTTTVSPAEQVHQHTSVVQQVLKPVIVNGTSTSADVGTKEEFAEAQDVYVGGEQEITSEKPLLSSRFGHRKPNRTTSTSPDQGAGAGVKALRVVRPKRQDTLESTWKTITEGRHRHVPLTRHLKKSEQHHLSPITVVDQVPKSKTFKDYRPRMIQKEASVGRDELNRRVEAFIKKFNDEMRIQRQESLNQYMEMINRNRGVGV